MNSRFGVSQIREYKARALQKVRSLTCQVQPTSVALYKSDLQTLL